MNHYNLIIPLHHCSPLFKQHAGSHKNTTFPQRSHLSLLNAVGGRIVLSCQALKASQLSPLLHIDEHQNPENRGPIVLRTIIHHHSLTSTNIDQHSPSSTNINQDKPTLTQHHQQSTQHQPTSITDLRPSRRTP